MKKAIFEAISTLCGVMFAGMLFMACSQKSDQMQSTAEQEVAYGIGLVQVQPKLSELDQLFEKLKQQVSLCVQTSQKTGDTTDIVYWDSKRAVDAEFPKFSLSQALNNKFTGGDELVLERFKITDDGLVWRSYVIAQVPQKDGTMAYQLQCSEHDGGINTKFDISEITNASDMHLAMTKFYDRMEQCKHNTNSILADEYHTRDAVHEVMQGF